MTKINKEGWEIKKLGEVTDFSRGLTYSGKDEVPTSSNVVLRSNNITLESQSLNLDELKYINDSIVIPTEKKLAKDTIFMCMSNGSMKHIGKVAFIDKDYDYAFGGFMGLMRPKAEVVFPKYLYFYFCSQEFKRVLAKIANGANINNIKFSDINQERIPLPPLSIQQRIVDELDEINAIISAKKQQLSKLDELAQSIFYNMFGDPVANEKGWEVKTLKELTTKLGSGATPRGGNQAYKEEGVSLIRSLNVHNNEFIYKDLAHIDDEQAKALNGVTIEEDDILLNITGASVARSCIVPKEVLPARVNQHVCIIRPKDIVVSYLARLLTSTPYQVHLIALATSKAATREALPKNLVEGLKIILPPLPLQEAFAARVSAIEEEKAAIAASIEKMQTLLDARMQEYFG